MSRRDRAYGDPEPPHRPRRVVRSDSWSFRMRKFFFRLFLVALTLTIPILLTIGVYLWRSSSYPLEQVLEMPARTVLLDRYGRELDTIHGTRRRLISPEEIPPFFKKALLAREDWSFENHHGIDPRGLARATLRNLKDADFTQGASTLTMQLARNSFDLRAQKSLDRKFLELALTHRIEKHFTKEEILTAYLNRIYFGAGAYGLERAAQTYFGRSAHDLTRNQSALLVGIIRGPHAFSPFRNLEGALRQRDEVLARLVALQQISPAEQDQIRSRDLALRSLDETEAGFPQAARALRRPLEKILTRSEVTVGGLTVASTIDPVIQKNLESLEDVPGLPEGLRVAAIALQPSSGEVLGISGGKGYGLNRALDASRGIGPDLIEPLLAAACQERHYVPVPGKPVATGRQLGHQEATRLLRRFGFAGRFGSGDDLFRGVLSASPAELALAYATLLNDGERPTLRFLTEVREGETTIARSEKDLHPAFSPRSTQKILPKSLSGRSLSKRDYWFTDNQEDLLTVVWVGYDQSKPFTLAEETLKKINQALKGPARL